MNVAQRAAVEVAFHALTDLAEIGIQSMAYLLGGGWWILSGMLLRPYRRWLGVALDRARRRAWTGAETKETHVARA